MSKIKVNVTFDEELMKRIDDYAEENYLNRSSFLTFAANQFLNQAEVASAMKLLSLAMQKISENGNIDEETKKKLEDFERIVNFIM